jgi:hypothetical protein
VTKNRPRTKVVAGSSRMLGIVTWAAVLTVAAVLRIRGAANDLWLDEIWSLQLAGTASSPIEVFTKIHHDNNHYLNTLYLYWMGPNAESPCYRIPSILAGIGSTALAWLIARRRDVACAWFAMLLVGTSYVLVLYSSEARGYAMAVFFAFLSFYLLDAYLKTRTWWTAVLFSLASVLGILSHLTFLSFYLAALAWSCYRLLKDRGSVRQVVMAAVSCHALPIPFIGALYLVDIRLMEVGGGASSPSLIHSYGTALAWALGTPATDAMKFIACVVAVVLLTAGVRLLWREGSDQYVFYLGAILVFPTTLVMLHGSMFVDVRIFLIALAFLLLLSSAVLSWLWRQGRPGRLICVLSLAAFLTANGWHIATLFEYGRGQYSDAIRLMADQSHRASVVIGGDHDFRIATTLSFHGPRVLRQRASRYCEQGSWPPEGPEWVICHSYEDPTPPLPQIKDNKGNEYELVKSFETTSLSGLKWFIYHNRAN